MPHASIPRASTLLLKAVIVLIGIAVLIFCGFWFPMMWSIGAWEFPKFRLVLYPGFFGLAATTIPFYIALFQTLKLLRNIDHNTAFSESSIRALRTIKFCAIAMSALYALCMPMVFVFAEIDDAPGVILVGAAITCAPLIVATFAAVLQKLVQNALDMKLENDLTV